MRRAVYRSKCADYRTYVAECTELIRQANDQHNMREVHRTVHKLTGKKRVQSNLSMTSNEQLLLCERDRLEEWASYFEQKFAGNPVPLPTDVDGVLPTTNAEKDLIQTPSLTEVEKAVFALKTQRAFGVYDIPADFWHVPQACQALHNTICSVWLSEELPNDWLCGEMITIWKGKGSKNDSKSYRSITLLCAAAKAMSAIIAKRISVVAVPKMQDSQSGFRAGCSCADQISIMRALMRRALATDRTLYVALLDFDACDLRYIDESLKHHKVPLKLRRQLHALYNGAKSRVKGSKGSRSR